MKMYRINITSRGVANQGGKGGWGLGLVLRISSDGDDHQMGAKIKAQKSKIPD